MQQNSAIDNALVVLVRVTEYCNLGCQFCEYNKNLRKNRAVINDHILMDLGDILSAYKQKSKRNIMVSWMGGEPLLWKNFSSMTRVFQDYFQLKVSTTTNGLLLSDKNIFKTILGLDEITISIDGFGEIHDSGRNHKGLYNKVLQGIRSISINKVNKNPLIRVNTLLTKHSIVDFDLFCEEMVSVGVQQLTFNQLVINKDQPHLVDQCITSEQFKYFLDNFPTLRTKYQNLGLDILGSRHYLERIRNYVQSIRVPISDCLPGRSYLFVDLDGHVGPCAYTTNDFQLNLDEFRNLLNSDLLENFYRKLKSNSDFEACSDCPATHVFGKFEKATEEKTYLELS